MDELEHGSVENENPIPGGEAVGSVSARRALIARQAVAEAVRPGRRAEESLRLLNLVHEMELPLGAVELLSLQSLLRHRSTAVRQKAEQLIMAASPCGLPASPETAALMRAFNPFLQSLPRSRPPRRTRLSDFAAALRGDWAAARRRARSSAAMQERDEREEQKRRRASRKL